MEQWGGREGGREYLGREEGGGEQGEGEGDQGDTSLPHIHLQEVVDDGSQEVVEDLVRKW